MKIAVIVAGVVVIVLVVIGVLAMRGLRKLTRTVWPHGS